MDEFLHLNRPTQFRVEQLFSSSPLGQSLLPSQVYLNGTQYDNEQCQAGTFKCPQYYCVHLRFVCDGYFDCPFGYEEHNCENRTMPGMFHCKNTSIYIAPQSVCDTTVDCPVGDDEVSCDIARLKCPYGCDCLLYAMSCDNIRTSPQSFALKFKG